jgi:fructose-specific phosphotransferase system IIA component
MRIVELLSPENIYLDCEAKDKETVWQTLSESLHQTGAVVDVQGYLRDVKKRESEGTTGVGFGVAIPHAKSAAVKKPALAMARLNHGVDVASLDGTMADLFFLIAAPLHGEDVHLQALSKLARMLIYEDFLAAMRQAKTKPEIIQAISARETDE